MSKVEWSKFLRCHAVTAKWEGGWSDHPADPGGRTMFGITERVYHAWLKKKGSAPRSVRLITRAEAEQIFHDDYWIPSGGPTLWPGVDLATYDASVNSGVSRGRRWLMESVGGPHHITVQRICRKRLSFLSCLKGWVTFGRGWTRRVCDIEVKGVAWALAAQSMSDEVIKKQLQQEATDAKKKANKDAVGGAGTAAGGGATVAVIEDAKTVVDTPHGASPAVPGDPSAPLPGMDQGGILDTLASWGPTLILVAVLAIVLFLIVRSMVNRHRADSFAREARTHS